MIPSLFFSLFSLLVDFCRFFFDGVEFSAQAGVYYFVTANARLVAR